MSDWRPIETAPRNGTKIWLAYKPSEFAHAGWGCTEGYWRLDRTWFPLLNPTHWMPIK